MMRKNNQQGFVSLITTILISLLLVIVTLSMVAVEALQLRTAEDAEQSMRAYYTAEAGTEDAVAKILSKSISLTNNQSCEAGSPYYDPSGSSNWTCQQISFSGQPSGNLKADQAVTVDPGTANYQSVEIEWNQSNDVTASHYDINTTTGFPSLATFQADQYAAPPIELQIVEYPNGGFNENEVCDGDPAPCGGYGAPNEAFLSNALITPAGNASGVVPYTRASLYQNGTLLQGNCAPAPRANPYSGNSQYNCYALLSNLPANKSYLFRIRSRYADSSYRFTFWSNPDGTGNQVVVPSGMATIDVTAQAGGVYRRVVSNLPINSSAAAGLNYVMYSDTNVCKNFQVINNAPPPSVCP